MTFMDVLTELTTVMHGYSVNDELDEAAATRLADLFDYDYLRGEDTLEDACCN